MNYNKNKSYLDLVNDDFLNNKGLGIDLDEILKIQFPYITNKQISVLKNLNINPFLFKHYQKDEYLLKLVFDFYLDDVIDTCNLFPLVEDKTKKKNFEEQDFKSFKEYYEKLGDNNISKNTKKYINDLKDFLNIYKNDNLIFFEVGHVWYKYGRNNYINVYLDPMGRFVSNVVIECLMKRKIKKDYESTIVYPINTKPPIITTIPIENINENFIEEINNNTNYNFSNKNYNDPKIRRGGKPERINSVQWKIRKGEKDIIMEYKYDTLLDLYYYKSYEEDLKIEIKNDLEKKKYKRNFVKIYFNKSKNIYPLMNIGPEI
jgi:hypothetical protein